MPETVLNAIFIGTVWKEETNAAAIIKNKEILKSSIFGDIIQIIAPGDAKFSPVEVLDAQETWDILREIVALTIKSSVERKKFLDETAKIEAEAKHRVAVDDAVKRILEERSKGGE